MFKFYTACVWKWGQDIKPVTVKAECALLLYTEGRAFVDFQRKRKILKSKLLLYVQPEATVTIMPVDDKELEVTGLFFHAYALEEEDADRLVYRLDYSMLPNNGFVLKPIMQRTPALVRELVRQSGEAAPDNYICDRALNEIVHQISLHMSRSSLARTTAEQAVAETIRSMLAHCERNWTREEAARSKQFNVSHFSRLFQTVSSYNFSEMLSKIRLNRARILLLSTNMTLDHIAHRTGFMNGLYLSRRFKKECGMSPTAYRGRMQNKTLRIATMQQAGDLLALGIVPVAVSFAPWHTAPLLQKQLLEAGAASIYELEDTELLRELAPDLILLPDYVLTQNASRLRQLEKIAPVLFFPVYEDDTFMRLGLLADIFGRRAEAKRWLETYQANALLWKGRLSAIIAPDETAAVYEIRGERQIIIFLKGCRSSYNFYQTLQLQPPPLIRQKMKGHVSHFTISVEELPRFAADHMFVISDTGHNPQQLYQVLAEHRIWSALPALQGNRVYSLSLQHFWSDDAAALEVQLPMIVEAAEQVQR